MSRTSRIIVALLLGCGIASIPYAVEDLPSGLVRTAGVALSTPGILIALQGVGFTGGNAHSMSRLAVNVGNVLFYSVFVFAALKVVPKIVRRKRL